MQFDLHGGETSQDIVRLIRRAQIIEVAKGFHEYDRHEFQINRRHPVASCFRHMRDAAQFVNYADEG